MGNLKFKIGADFWAFIVVAIVFKQGYFAATYAIAVILHEVAHYLVAKRLFYRCTHIRLGIFGAVLYGDFQDIRGADRIKVALAGPVCNLCACVLCLALWWMLPESYYFTELFFTANCSMACANLLPCYPLDGGRVLTGVLENKYPFYALKVTKIITYALSGVLFMAFLLSIIFKHPIYGVGLFAACLFFGVFTKSGGECYTKSTLTQNKFALKHGMEKKILVFCENSLLADVAKRMRGNYLYSLEVVDADMNTLRHFGIAELENLVLKYPLKTPLKELTKRP